MAFMTFHILGISSSQLTHIFQRGRYTTNQLQLWLALRFRLKVVELEEEIAEDWTLMWRIWTLPGVSVGDRASVMVCLNHANLWV